MKGENTSTTSKTFAEENKDAEETLKASTKLHVYSNTSSKDQSPIIAEVDEENESTSSSSNVRNYAEESTAEAKSSSTTETGEDSTEKEKENSSPFPYKSKSSPPPYYYSYFDDHEKLYVKKI